jgi:hypothetical protein
MVNSAEKQRGCERRFAGISAETAVATTDNIDVEIAALEIDAIVTGVFESAAF